MIKIAVENIANKNFKSYFGCDSSKYLRKIDSIYRDKKRYFNDIKDGTTFNFNYDLMSMEKIIVSKQWEYLKNNEVKYQNLLNENFNDKLEIKYNHHNI